ncbi:MAG: tRNA ((46)-N7)-methyltransferase TrmB [Frankiales bacterium]|nr:tRNA ((46)-N7)-methyltransferase TrmB [Frankiales bacterium]
MQVSEPIRSYKKRASRVTAGQQRALDAYFPRFAVDGDGGPVDPVDLFGRDAPLVVEIGFGMGETTAAMAAADPATDVIAIDVHTPGVGALLADVGRRRLTNVRVAAEDAVPFVQTRIPDGSLAGLRVYFPDPWPKPRHHKRRLVDAAFVELAATKLRSGGTLHCATDWESYAVQMLAVVTADGRFDADGFSPRPEWRPVTRFENQGRAKGHEVYDVIARRR